MGLELFGPLGIGLVRPVIMSRSTDGEFGNSAYYTATRWSLDPLPFVDSFFIRFENSRDSSDWIEILMFVELDGSARAYANHSAGYGCYVNVYVHCLD